MIAVPAIRVMTRRAFARYSLTGETFSAHEARAAGLLTATVDDGELDRWVEAAVASFLLSSPDAIRITKRLFEVVWEQDWDEAMETAIALSDATFGSAHAAEGIGAFLEKRPPQWVDPA
jgi:enoyl-CoA hydratase/carnithine racemase